MRSAANRPAIGIREGHGAGRHAPWSRCVLVAVLAATAAGCGNYSTEDLRFLSALPRREHLSVAVPSNTGSGPTALTTALVTTAACPAIGDANVWRWAKPTSDGLNGGVSWIVGLIDAVRRAPPTHRSDDSRRWGPFDDDKHPGREIQIVIDRSWPSGPDGQPVFDYRFEGRVKGTSAFTVLLGGFFQGASATAGHGNVVLYFDSFWTLGMQDAGTPHGRMDIQYVRDQSPVQIDLVLSQPGFSVVSFGYHYEGYGDGRGLFRYAFHNALGDLLEVQANHDPAGAGRLAVAFTPKGATTPAGSFRQCWDKDACLTYVDDPLNLSCGVAPCSAGASTACVAVPAPLPF